MNLNLTLLGQAITFGIFVWFTMKYVWPPIMQAIDERQKKIADGLQAAEQGQAQLRDAEKTAHDELAQARKKALDIIEQANKRSDDIVAQAQTRAQEEGQRLLTQAQAQITQEAQRAREKLQKEVAAFAIAGAEKLLERNIDEQSNQDLINQFAEGI